MTAPVRRFTRRATDVDALPLADLHHLHLGEVWLRGHGVDTAHRHPALAGRGLLVPGPGGLLTVARVGQWLVHDLTVGKFLIEDDDDFRALHRPPGGRGDLEALIDATTEPKETRA